MIVCDKERYIHGSTLIFIKIYNLYGQEIETLESDWVEYDLEEIFEKTKFAIRNVVHESKTELY